MAKLHSLYSVAPPPPPKEVIITTSSPTGPAKAPIENLNKWGEQWVAADTKNRAQIAISDAALNGGGLGQQGETWGDFGRQAAEKAGEGGKVYLAAGHGVEAETAKGKKDAKGNWIEKPTVAVDLIQGRDSLAVIPEVLDPSVEEADNDLILNPAKYQKEFAKNDPVKGLEEFKAVYKAATDRKQTRKALDGFAKGLAKHKVSAVEILACYVGYGAVGMAFVKSLAKRLGVTVIAATVYLDTKKDAGGEVSIRYEYPPSDKEPSKVASSKWTTGSKAPKGDVSAPP